MGLSSPPVLPQISSSQLYTVLAEVYKTLKPAPEKDFVKLLHVSQELQRLPFLFRSCSEAVRLETIQAY